MLGWGRLRLPPGLDASGVGKRTKRGWSSGEVLRGDAPGGTDADVAVTVFRPVASPVPGPRVLRRVHPTSAMFHALKGLTDLTLPRADKRLNCSFVSWYLEREMGTNSTSRIKSACHRLLDSLGTRPHGRSTNTILISGVSES